MGPSGPGLETAESRTLGGGGRQIFARTLGGWEGCHKGEIRGVVRVGMSPPLLTALQFVKRF